MASPLDLTTLAAAKAWLNITNTNSDGVLSLLVTASSRMVVSYLQRPSLLPRSFSERYDGQGTRRLFLRNWPVLSVSSLVIGNSNVPQAVPPGPNQNSFPSGFLIQPWDGTPPGQMQAIDLYRGQGLGGPWSDFEVGKQNVAVTYTAGYAVMGEAATLTTTSYTALQPYGPWASDQGVTYSATGVALTPSSGAPGPGQYSVNPSTGVYTINVADENKPLLFSYGFVPQDIAQAVNEFIGERFRYRDRIGKVSESLGGNETVTFSQANMPGWMKLALQPYRSVVPVWN